MIRRILLLLSLCAVTPIFAQSNIGIDYYLLGEHEKAGKYFESQLSSNPAEANLYLGEIAFAKGDVAKAAEYYNKCAESDPSNVFCMIAQAKLKLKSDPKAGEAALESIAKNNKKNIPVLIAIGRAYLDNGMSAKAMDKVSAARSVNSKSPESYILEGDIIVAGGGDAIKIGEAAGKYEMSTYFNPDYALGYMKRAQMYEFNNPSSAIEELKTVVEKYPDYIPAYGLLSKIYTTTGFYPQAIEAFKTYFESPYYTPEDIERYARALYFTDNLEEAQKMVTRGLRENADHFVLNRYQLYIYAKKGNYTDGLKLAENFLSLSDQSRYIPMDYTMYATLLKEAKRYDEAAAQYDRAIKLEPDNPQLYKEASEMVKEMKNFGKSGEYYKTYMEKKALASENPEYKDELVDINMLGYDYYSAGTTISKNPELAGELMKDNDLIAAILASDSGLAADSLAENLQYFTAAYSKYYLNKAGATFSKLIEQAPESYSGYRFKALTEHALNPDVTKGTARDYYEKMIEIITSKEDWQASASMKRMALEGFGYLAYYYYMTDNAEKAIYYCEKVLELDPENANAKAILGDLRK